MTKKNITYVSLMTCVMFLDLAVIYLKNYDIKVDVYLFYGHSRYLDNIVYDIRNMSYFSISSFILMKYNKVFSPFFVVSLFQIIMYFLYYKQNENYIEIPILLTLLIWTIKNKKA